MVDKVLIIDHEEWENGIKLITRLYFEKCNDALYAETVDNSENTVSYETVELAVNKDQMIRIRNFLNTILGDD